MMCSMIMNVSIIIPAYNNERTIGLVVDALKNQKYDYGCMELIIIDDGSSDSTIEICEAYGLKVIRNKMNYGLGFTLNKGIELSEHEIVVTLHADTLPLSNTWLSELVEPLLNSDYVASCSFQYSPDCTNDDLSIWEKFLWARYSPHHALNNQADAYKKNVVAGVGFFDDKTFKTATEDEDMALRLRLHKKKFTGSSAKTRHIHQFSFSSIQELIIKILKREHSLGRGSGALRRKYPLYKPGAYVFPTPKPFTYDAAMKVIICLSCFIPYLQIICIPFFIYICFLGIFKTMNYVGFLKTLFLYPIFNGLRVISFTLGYCYGLVSGNQR